MAHQALSIRAQLQSVLPLWIAVGFITFFHAEAGAITRTQVKFEDLKPANCTLTECWNGMGMDDRGRAYIGFTSSCGGKLDFVVFRYDPSSGARRYIGTLRTTSGFAGNLVAGEEIPKGHTHFEQIGRKLYLGSQGFHDFKQQITGLENYRGSHLYAYDLDRDDSLRDMSALLPGGVVQQHQGMIACRSVPGTSYLAGLSHPYSDIIMLNTATQHVDTVVPGIPWELWHVISREIIPTKYGKIYTARGNELPSNNTGNNPVWVYDLAAKRFSMTSYTIYGGYISGAMTTTDGERVYLTTSNGELFVLQTATGAIAHLTHFLTQAEYASGKRIEFLWGMAMSSNDRKIFGINSLSGTLYEYDIASGVVARLQELGSGYYTGVGMHDSRGNIYFAGFNTDMSNVRLEILNIGDRVHVQGSSPAKHGLREDTKAKSAPAYDIRGRTLALGNIPYRGVAVRGSGQRYAAVLNGVGPSFVYANGGE
jgi:hypothetical protein